MSKALQYLLDSRPEAMESYFKFLKSNGASLDPTTRALISIITKVANQTEAGLKQYALKAIRDGISSDQILDAIMMAFPVLGLTKTVWAVDVLLGCGVFASDVPDDVDTEKWHDICSTNEDTEIQVVECDGRSVFAVVEAGNWRVFNAQCSHHGTTLAFCKIQGATVECSLHGWRFDLRNGDCIRFGTKGLQEFKTQINESRLLALW